VSTLRSRAKKAGVIPDFHCEVCGHRCDHMQALLTYRVALAEATTELDKLRALNRRKETAP
jgi:hypothetical protein